MPSEVDPARFGCNTSRVSSPRRVLRVITRLNIGGPARQALLLSKELTDFQTRLVVGHPEPAEGELLDADVAIDRVPLTRPINPLQDVRAYRCIDDLLTIFEPNLVHTHMAKAGALARFAASRSQPRPKIVHTYHGHVLEGYFKSATQRTFIEIERRLASRSDVLIAVSSEVRDSLLDLGIGTASKFRVIPLGFDLEPLLRENPGTGEVRRGLGIGADTHLVGVLGRLAPVKEHEVLLSAVESLPDVHLAIFGDGELRRRLVQQARTMQISDRVHFMGWWSDVSAALGDLDVVALTSRNEGTPVSLIEAHARGLPVVATDVGGVRAVVEDGVTGYVVRVGDADAVAGHLQRLLEAPALRNKMGEAGRQRVRVRFDKKRLVTDIRALYDDLLS